MPPVLGAADEQRAAVTIKRQMERDHRQLPAPQHVHQKRMTGVGEVQARAEDRNTAVEFVAEAGFGEDQIQRSHDGGGGTDSGGMSAKTVCEFAQDAVDLAHLFLLQADEFVVEVDGFERFQKQGLACVARTVHHARQFAALPGDDGDNKTVIADGDVFVL